MPESHRAGPIQAGDDHAGPRHIAIVGAGPAGLFTAAALLAKAKSEVRIDILDRLPTPFGLLRYGVAPDHTSIKAVATALAKVFDAPSVRFLGLVDVGRAVSAGQLREAYDAVVYAVGAAADRRLGVPGENLPGSLSAREFVAWYSGHPDAERQRLTGVSGVVVIGVGNVAVDVTRILAKDPATLRATDMPDGVLAELAQTRIKDLWLVGRRGLEDAAFTTPELRELLNTPGLGVRLIGGDPATVDPGNLDRRARSNITAITEAVQASPATAERYLHLVFRYRPAKIIGPDRVRGVELTPTGDSTATLRLPADLVLRSIGYRGVALPGLPFEDGRIPNLEGRVLGEDGVVRPGEYAVGWIKRGPVGLIGANKRDASQTVAKLLEDLPGLPRRGPNRLDSVLEMAGVRPSTFAQWRQIDAAEIERGSLRGRERTKIEAWHDLLDLVRRT